MLIYSGNTRAKHQAIVEEVLEQYIEDGLEANLLKSELYVHKFIFLVRVINSQ